MWDFWWAAQCLTGLSPGCWCVTEAGGQIQGMAERTAARAADRAGSCC
ncbi:hypothetical protein LI019_10450 [Enterocloster bolteae]|nr:hypothetical protein [Enterocloster bolteae]